MEKVYNDNIKEKIAFFWFSKCEEISFSTIRKIINNFKGAYQAYSAGVKEINDFIKETNIKQKGNLNSIFHKSISYDELYDEYESLQKRGINFYIASDMEYPENLKHIFEPPMWIYVWGKLPKQNIPSVAVIGARSCSIYGKEIAIKISEELSEFGIQIISGMAAGIDGYAHKGAIVKNAPTFAVLGSGVDVCYPADNFSIYKHIIKSGGIISEYPLKSKGLPFHFPMRNRIISGLSDAVLVVEARERSGTFITVDRALEQGKDVFAVPGRIGDELSTGCNRLIKGGAFIALSAADIIDEIYPKYVKYFNEICTKGNLPYNGKEDIKDKKNNKALETKEKMVYARLSLVPKHTETIIEETGFKAEALMHILCGLELKGLIKQVYTGYYIRIS